MWAHAVSAIIGIWFMAAPDLLEGFTQAASANNRIFGPLIVSCGIVALWEAMRSVRFGNTLVGSWLLISSLFMGYSGMALVINMIAAAVVIGLSLVRGEHNPLKFGGGWVSLWNEEMWEKGQHNTPQEGQ